jgi:DNA-binding transcriptional regulator LsrR (DeoR family)
MAKVKELVTEICEMYDYQGMTIAEIANYMEMTDAEVVQVLSDYSDTFGMV